MVEQRHPQLLELPSTLIGSEEINVRILKGGLAIDETIRNLIRTRLQTHLNDEEYLLRLFVGGKWRFLDDGRFLFIPAPNANVGSELFPIPGKYHRVEDRWELQGQRESGTDRVVSLDGSLYRLGDRWRVEVLYAIASQGMQIVQISQVLALTTGSEISDIQGFPVPSTFCIQLSGQVDGQTFEGLTGTLKLQPHFHRQDTNPCVVRLATDHQGGIGRFLWWSFEGTATNEGMKSGIVGLHDSQAHIEFIPNQSVRAGLTWDTQNTRKLAELLPLQGVDVQVGTLNFAINGEQISGSIRASGCVFGMMSDGTAPVSTYEAQFVGHRQTEDWDSWLEDLSRHQFSGSVNNDAPTHLIPIPSVFEIELCGETNEQSFEELSGTLTVASRMNSADPNPFSVALFAHCSQVNQHGYLQWQTFNDVGDRQVLESRVFVEAGQVRLEVEPSDTFRSLTWQILAPDGQVQFVQIERGTMTFSTQDDQLYGEIDATGITLDDHRIVRTYHAQITGHKRSSPFADGLRTLFNSSDLEGIWEMGDRPFGTIELRVRSDQVTGVYTAHGGGTITGIIDAGRLDFSWRDQYSEGTGWARVLGNRGLLIGGWQESSVTNHQPFFVGTRQYLLMLESRTLTNQDVDELRAIGLELWLQDRGELAIPLLEKVLEFYKTQRLASSGQDSTITLIEEGKVIGLLIQCEMQCHRYDRLPQRLQSALKLGQLLDPRTAFKQQFGQKIDELSSHFTQSLNQLQEMQPHLWEQSLTTKGTIESNHTYSLLGEHLEDLQTQLSTAYQELTEFKDNMNRSHQESDLTWMPLVNFLSNQRLTLLAEIDKILQRQKQYFHQEPDLLNFLELVLQSLNFQVIQGATLTVLAELNTLETQIMDRLSNHASLSDLEKGLFLKQYVVMMVLISVANQLEVFRTHLVSQEEADLLSQWLKTIQQSITGLSAHLESWRGSLVKEIDKIDALAQGQLFFQQLIPLLVDFKAYEEALMTAEKGKTRAFADLLATQTDLQPGIRQVFSTEKVLLSIAQAPSMDFQAVVQLLQP